MAIRNKKCDYNSACTTASGYKVPRQKYNVYSQEMLKKIHTHMIKLIFRRLVHFFDPLVHSGTNLDVEYNLHVFILNHILRFSLKFCFHNLISQGSVDCFSYLFKAFTPHQLLVGFLSPMWQNLNFCHHSSHSLSFF